MKEKKKTECKVECCVFEMALRFVYCLFILFRRMGQRGKGTMNICTEHCIIWCIMWHMFTRLVALK